MSGLEPKDSRDVTLSDKSAPGEPERTGYREGETRPDDEKAGDESGREAAHKKKAGDGDPLQQAKPQDGAQASYGNSRDKDGKG